MSDQAVPPTLRGAAATRDWRARALVVAAVAGVARRLALYAGRSLFPLVALLLILGTFAWGPWVTLVLSAAWWTAVTRWA